MANANHTTMSEIAINIMNKPECDCDQDFVEELGINGHFASCAWLQSLTPQELLLVYPDYGE